jgi:hypothetical protein
VKRRNRYVRVRLDFVLDIGREFDGMPHEMTAFADSKTISVTDANWLISHGLMWTLRKHKNVRLMRGAKCSLKTTHERPTPVVIRKRGAKR